MSNREARIVVNDLQLRVPELQRPFGGARLRHVSKHQHHPLRPARLVYDGGTGVGDRALGSIACQEDPMVCRLTGAPLLRHMLGATIDRNPRLFSNDPENVCKGLSVGRGTRSTL